ncbi:13754_t:CDS:2 [Entrophospora sp. SA101]|nr:727_t:CDS:2 [Entrophospora sp. SA101]CAJ0895951.1 13754_t:CDS:2 [Entrophospora sp. SA101]CAJ0922616.1 20384_t:CDS:2 [Entrophospora sp. SA101]
MKKNKSPKTQQELENTFEIVNHVQNNRNNINNDLTFNYNLSNSSSSESSPTTADSDDSLRTLVGNNQVYQRGHGNHKFATTALSSFHVAYLGEKVPETCISDVFQKLSEGLGEFFCQDIIEEEAIDGEQFSREKRYIIYPQGSEINPKELIYTDTGVSLYTIDLTNKKLSVAKNILLEKYLNIKSDDNKLENEIKQKKKHAYKRFYHNWIDLCVIFLPSNLLKIPSTYISTMLELQKYVTLFPIICSVDSQIGLDEQNRRKLYKYLVSKKIQLFLWGDGYVRGELLDGPSNRQLPKGDVVDSTKIQNLMHNRKFLKLESDLVYKDMHTLRAQAIKLKKNHKLKINSSNHENQFKKKEILIIASILAMLVVYFIIFLVANLSLLNILPGNSYDKIHNSLLGNKHFGNNVQYKGSSEYIQVWQLPNNKFLFDIIDSNYAKDKEFEVILQYDDVTSVKKEVNMIDENQYSFNIDFEEFVGVDKNLLIKITDKNGTIIKEFNYFQTNERILDGGSEEEEEPIMMVLALPLVQFINEPIRL